MIQMYYVNMILIFNGVLIHKKYESIKNMNSLNKCLYNIHRNVFLLFKCMSFLSS